MVCHWSRIRPVLSRSGKAAEVASLQRRRLRRHEAGLAVGGEEAAFGEEALLARRRAWSARPRAPAIAPARAHRSRRREMVGQAAEIEIARAVVLERRQRRMLAEHIGRAADRKTPRQSPGAAPPADDDPPVGLGFARHRQEGALARDAALRIGDGAVLLAPGGGGQQHMRRPRSPCRWRARSRRRRTAPACSSAVAHGAGARQRHRRIGRHDPQRLDLAALDRLEHLHRLAAFARAPCAARSRTGARGRSRRGRSPYGRRAGWRARRPRGRPWHWAGR